MTYDSGCLIWRDHAHYTPSARNTAVIFKSGLVTEGENEYANLTIGGPDEVRALIGDLSRLLARMDPPAVSATWKEVADDATVDSLERDLCQCVTCIDKAQLINRVRADKQTIEAYKQRHTDELAKAAKLDADANELRTLWDAIRCKEYSVGRALLENVDARPETMDIYGAAWERLREEGQL